MGAMASRRQPAACPPVDLDVKRCLGFVNTRTGRATASPTERLVSFDALLQWSVENGVLSAAERDRLRARASRRQAEAERVLADACHVRELLHAAFTATSEGRAPSPATLNELSTRLGTWYQHGRLVPAGDSLQWVYAGGDDLDRVLWEMARSATRLLTSPALARVRACAAPDCGWWFLDDTRNRSRRWCDMKICGNREKLRRFRERHAGAARG
jgi:predicted RNA-binding Zn ribbon-like protein